MVAVIKALLQAGADFRFSHVIRAVGSGKVPIVSLLLDWGAQLVDADHELWFLAKIQNDPVMVAYFATRDTMVLKMAVRLGKAALVLRLLQAGASAHPFFGLRACATEATLPMVCMASQCWDISRHYSFGSRAQHDILMTVWLERNCISLPTEMWAWIRTFVVR
jgi:hypothetical protein